MAKKNLVQIHRVFLSFGHKIKSLKRIRYTFIKKVKKYEEQLSVINIYSFNPPTSSSQSSNPPPSSVLEESQIMETNLQMISLNNFHPGQVHLLCSRGPFNNLHHKPISRMLLFYCRPNEIKNPISYEIGFAILLFLTLNEI